MDQALSSQCSTSDLPLGQAGGSEEGEEGEEEEEQLRLRVDFFRKLGYSEEEARAALSKLGLGTDTNSVLGELVRSRTGHPSASDSDETGGAGHKDPLVPPSWAHGGPCRVPPQVREWKSTPKELRPVVIDGSNVAMSHGNKEVFSCRGIQLAVSFFLDRGHNTVTVFVPTWRKEQPRPDAPITDQHVLTELEKRQILVFTPSRRVGGKRVVCYDDRFIVKLAYESDGVIVSNDTYRDLQGERPEWKKCIEERLLMYSFVNDKFMPPDDPLGRNGPSLDNFLRKKPLPPEQKKQLCPYDKKCTYGIKCKYYHPERSNQSYLSLADELREKAHISTGKEDRNTRLSPKHIQADPGPAPNICYHHPQDSQYVREQKSYSSPGQVSENTLRYWEDPRESLNPLSHPVTVNHCQKEWPGLYPRPNQYCANVSLEYQDSGLGSYESQCSDFSHCLSNPLRPQPQPQQQTNPAGPGHASVHNTSQTCRCCSHVPPSTDRRQHHRNADAKVQPKYDTFPPNMFPSGVPHQQSLPGHFHYSGAQHHHHQPRYWSDPFQGTAHHARTSYSLPSSIPTAHSSLDSGSSFQGHPYHSWGGQQPPTPAAFEPQRSELRKKLQAIFNPHEVDTVMGMFPHLMDAEKIAAEILNLKAQRGGF